MNKIILISIIYTLSCMNVLQAKTFKIATSAPDGTYWMKQMRKGAQEIKEKTEGRVIFKYYPGGVMGSEEITLKKIRIRQLQGAAVSNGVLTSFYADSQIYSLPMIFKSFEEVDYVRQIIDKKIIKGLDEGGMISFGLSEGGFAYAMSTSPINKIEDLNTRKIWTPTNNKQAEVTLRSFGLTPIPLNIGDVLTGLQTNLIDTVAISPIVAIALQWHTQIKFITDVPLTYLYATLLIDKKSFNQISSQDKITVKTIMSKIFINIDEQNRKDNVAAFSALSKQGIKVISPNSETFNLWNKKGKLARETIRSDGILSNASYDEINNLLIQFRNKQETLGVSK
ncbi:MAG: TRAP transporter substrate-binding protein DctP [Gammaproteobacteria bacterium]|nr:TRAP transporter substrate-binding protein DctP [Gammaproteobacteria bacterium]